MKTLTLATLLTMPTTALAQDSLFVGTIVNEGSADNLLDYRNEEIERLTGLSLEELYKEGLKPLSPRELIQARVDSGSYWNVTNESSIPDSSKDTKAKFDWYVKMGEAILDYKKASNPRERLQAESRLCRIAEHIGTPIVSIDGNMYSPRVEHWNGYRIPKLEKVFETLKVPATISIADAKNDPLLKALLGGSEMCERYLAVARDIGTEKLGIYFDKNKLDTPCSRPLFFGY